MIVYDVLALIVSWKAYSYWKNLFYEQHQMGGYQPMGAGLLSSQYDNPQQQQNSNMRGYYAQPSQGRTGAGAVVQTG